MIGLNIIEKTITKKMQEAFNSTEDRKTAIHLAAAAGAAIVAALPIGIDAGALRIAEVVLVICIAGSYGEKLTKSAAKGIMLSSAAQLVGETAALSALEAAEASKVLNPLLAYGIKSSVAVAIIEALGHLVIAYYESPDGIGAKTCKAVEKAGFVADVSRATTFADSIDQSSQFPNSLNDSIGSPVSFTGSPKNLAEAAQDLKKAEGKVKQYSNYVNHDITFNQDTTSNSIKLDHAIKDYQRAQQNYNKIKAKTN